MQSVQQIIIRARNHFRTFFFCSFKQSNKIEIKTIKKKIYSSSGGHGTEGNGCARFVEIATQTVNLTNFLTNLNSSVSNCNNTSEASSEQIISPTVLSPNKSNDDPHDASNQSHNAKSNNGHCIIDGNSTADVNANEGIITQVTPLHHPLEIAAIDAGTMIDTYQGDSTNTDVIAKHDIESNVSVTVACEATFVGKTTSESETTTTDETELAKQLVSTDVINGPANDLRV